MHEFKKTPFAADQPGHNVPAETSWAFDFLLTRRNIKKLFYTRVNPRDFLEELEWSIPKQYEEKSLPKNPSSESSLPKNLKKNLYK